MEVRARALVVVVVVVHAAACVRLLILYVRQLLLRRKKKNHIIIIFVTMAARTRARNGIWTRTRVTYARVSQRHGRCRTDGRRYSNRGRVRMRSSGLETLLGMIFFIHPISLRRHAAKQSPIDYNSRPRKNTMWSSIGGLNMLLK